MDNLLHNSSPGNSVENIFDSAVLQAEQQNSAQNPEVLDGANVVVNPIDPSEHIPFFDLPIPIPPIVYRSLVQMTAVGVDALDTKWELDTETTMDHMMQHKEDYDAFFNHTFRKNTFLIKMIASPGIRFLMDYVNDLSFREKPQKDESENIIPEQEIQEEN